MSSDVPVQQSDILQQTMNAVSPLIEYVQTTLPIVYNASTTLVNDVNRLGIQPAWSTVCSNVGALPKPVQWLGGAVLGTIVVLKVAKRVLPRPGAACAAALEDIAVQELQNVGSEAKNLATSGYESYVAPHVNKFPTLAACGKTVAEMLLADQTGLADVVSGAVNQGLCAVGLRQAENPPFDLVTPGTTLLAASLAGSMKAETTVAKIITTVGVALGASIVGCPLLGVAGAALFAGSSFARRKTDSGKQPIPQEKPLITETDLRVSGATLAIGALSGFVVTTLPGIGLAAAAAGISAIYRRCKDQGPSFNATYAAHLNEAEKAQFKGQLARSWARQASTVPNTGTLPTALTDLITNMIQIDPDHFMGELFSGKSRLNDRQKAQLLTHLDAQFTTFNPAQKFAYAKHTLSIRTRAPQDPKIETLIETLLDSSEKLSQAEATAIITVCNNHALIPQDDRYVYTLSLLQRQGVSPEKKVLLIQALLAAWTNPQTPTNPHPKAGDNLPSFVTSTGIPLGKGPIEREAFAKIYSEIAPYCQGALPDLIAHFQEKRKTITDPWHVEKTDAISGKKTSGQQQDMDWLLGTCAKLLPSDPASYEKAVSTVLQSALEKAQATTGAGTPDQKLQSIADLCNQVIAFSQPHEGLAATQLVAFLNSLPKENAHVTSSALQKRLFNENEQNQSTLVAIAKHQPAFLKENGFLNLDRHFQLITHLIEKSATSSLLSHCVDGSGKLISNEIKLSLLKAAQVSIMQNGSPINLFANCPGEILPKKEEEWKTLIQQFPQTLPRLPENLRKDGKWLVGCRTPANERVFMQTVMANQSLFSVALRSKDLFPSGLLASTSPFDAAVLADPNAVSLVADLKKWEEAVLRLATKTPEFVKRITVDLKGEFLLKLFKANEAVLTHLQASALGALNTFVQLQQLPGANGKPCDNTGLNRQQKQAISTALATRTP